MDPDNIESQEELPNTHVSLPLELDTTYNLTICSECSTGLAFEWIPSHLTSKHGIKKQLDDVMEYLNIETPTLSSVEIKAWISEVWILSKAFQGVPIKAGMTCQECQFSSTTKKAMKTHFAAIHKGMKWSENIQRSNVQM